ncbi:zinc transporter ZIP10 [Plodia interpunctella]|uniref:zinc transporter ZIP10 n=1 Tax=Plodia interpunctella TaxID=58824 RepID=UPI002368EBB5|nr:zinc transporter ZIP10 [Plodia interpunctella]XP_053618323.1 zinc transporter ZIP10 [Plodia interpunctella]XP_053618405.1 zinc transporter ZIP10 [Plodia interpunctella]
MLTTCIVVAALATVAAADLIALDLDVNNTLPAEQNDTLPAEQFFIDKIFDKYGYKGVITFEGFEHLMDSLGLGGRVFTSPHDVALHRVNGSFRQLHDQLHRHKRSPKPTAETSLQKSCLSPRKMLEVYGIESEPGVITINPKTFLEMCPALVYQLDQRTCFKSEVPPPQIERHWTWIYASLSILVISATGLLGVAIVPLLKSVVFSYVLHFLVAIAVGTLCGDALLHLLPHALKSHGSSSEPQEETEVVLKCSVTFLTILFFYTVEAVMQTLHGGHKHSHDHSQGMTVEEMKTESAKQIEPIELGAMMPGAPPPPVDRPMTSTALMVIVGDGLHNLTDGLAIGAAFSGDPVTGFATALAVFCHELPHELGDFAVLLRSGMSIKRALYYNLLSSVLSFMGMAGGIWLAEDHESASQWIYAATAGTFFYIALADLVPEINENNHGKSLNLLLAVLGILAGGVIMLLIAIHEDSIQYLFKSAEQ